MRICQFNDDRVGLVDDNGHVRDVTEALAALPACRYPLPRLDLLIDALPGLKGRMQELAASAAPIPLGSVKLLSPVRNPGKIVAAPVNYKKHLDEVLADPNLHHQNSINTVHRAGLFLKATSSLVGASEGVAVALPDRRTDHEIELAVVIGKRCKNVPKSEALNYVAGYAIGLDITIRGPEERSLRKSLDTYTVLGPWLVTADEVPDPSNLDFELRVNGETRQRANTSDLILSVADQIEFVTRFYELQPGDIILTGTPEGVAPILPGDVMHARIDGIGEMTVNVR